MTTNLHISSEAYRLYEFSLSSSFTASMPNGVAALPRPSMFAEIFIIIYVSAAEFFLKPGKSAFVNGCKIRFKKSVILQSSAICIMPDQKQIIPVRVIERLTPFETAANSDSVKRLTFPFRQEKIIEHNIIKLQI